MMRRSLLPLCAACSSSTNAARSMTAATYSIRSGGRWGEDLGEPGKNRTCDPLIKSQLLYRLSYGLSQERRNLVADSGPVNEGYWPCTGIFAASPRRKLGIC